MEFLYTNKKINSLAAAFKDGDQRAAEKLFNYFYPAIFRYIRSRLTDKEATADVAQDVFLKLAKSIVLYDAAKGNFSTWFWQIARNTFTDHLRSLQRDHSQSETQLDIALDSMEASLDNTESVRERMTEVKEIIQEFSEEDQELFRLRYIAELSFEEIAELTDRTENALRVSLHRIREKIKKEYDKKD
ncbi:MAG: sigma-70 family RNA polymerase sigma factor [Patescibacteria group bacterium]